MDECAIWAIIGFLSLLIIIKLWKLYIKHFPIIYDIRHPIDGKPPKDLAKFLSSQLPFSGGKITRADFFRSKSK